MKRKARKKTFVGQKYDPGIAYLTGIPQPEVLLDMIDAYQLHPWVYAAVYAISSNMAGLEYEIFKEFSEEDKPDLSHPFRKLMDRPNPFISPYELKEWTEISKAMTGNAYWYLERDNKGMPYEIWPIPSHMIKAVSSMEQPVSHYLYEVDNRTIRFEYNDIIHFKETNPKSLIYGQGAILAARTEITTDLFASNWNKNFFKHSARPDAILETDKVLTTDVRNRLLSAWKQLHQGVKNSHRIALLEAGTKFKESTRSHLDMEFSTQKKASREMILAVFGVPPAIVGVLEYANYANIKEQTSIFWRYTLLPKVRRNESTLTMRVAQIYSRPGSYFQAILEYVEALRQDLSALSTIALNFARLGIPTNSIIDSLDLPFEHIDGGDESFSFQNNPSLEVQPVKKIKSVPLQIEVDTKDERNEKRTIVWKKFDSELRPYDDKMESTVRSIFRAQRERVLRAFGENSQKFTSLKSIKAIGDIRIDLIFDDKEEGKLFAESIEPRINKTFMDFAKKTSKEINSLFDWNMQDPYSLAWINNKKFQISQQANDYTKDQLTDGIVEAIENATREGLSEGETIAQIVERIDDVYDFALKGRAERIARTEVIGASNAGALEGMKKTGVERKEWLSSRDNDVRDTHAELDSEIVGINENFVTSSGVHLSAPGDAVGDAPEEVINCRCKVLPVVGDDK